MLLQILLLDNYTFSETCLFSFDECLALQFLPE